MVVELGLCISKPYYSWKPTDSGRVRNSDWLTIRVVSSKEARGEAGLGRPAPILGTLDSEQSVDQGLGLALRTGTLTLPHSLIGKVAN